MKQLKHLFIINPAAAKGIAFGLEQRIGQLFREIQKRWPDTSCQIVKTEYPGHGEIIAREYSAREPYRIYSVGGDGTLNEVLNGLAGSDSCLAVIPGGTGNDFFQFLAGNIPPRELLKETILGSPEPVDVGQINGRYFLNVASVGFDARVNERTAGFKRKPLVSARAAYMAGILASLWDRKPLELTLDDGRGERHCQVFMLTMCNGQAYGGGYRIAPEAQINDGLLDILEVAPLSLLDMVKYMPMLKQGTHLGQEVINFYRSNRLYIRAERELLVNIDGESSFARELDVRLHPGLVQVVFPRGARKTAKGINPAE